MSFELDTLSYTLLGSIFGAAALLSVRNARGPDIHPLLLNTQSDVSRVRYPGSTAVYRSRMYPNGSPLLTTSDRSLRTLQDWYLSALDKFRAKTFIGERSGSFYAWVSTCACCRHMPPLFEFHANSHTHTLPLCSTIMVNTSCQLYQTCQTAGTYKIYIGVISSRIH